MKHCGTEKIESERLLLRKFTTQDADAMYLNWAGDAEVTKYLTWQTHENVDVSKAILQDWVSHYSEMDYYQWAIIVKDNGDKPIGSIAVVHKDDKVKMAHIGYCIGKQWWNQGITSEALNAVMNFLFAKVSLNRIESRHDTHNPNSGKVMVKCGMKYEGTMREADWNNQGICDSSMYSILRSEYECKVANF